MGDSAGAAGGSGSGSVSGGSGSAACRQEPRGEPAQLQVPGFQQLSWLLPKHSELTELSFMLLLGQPVRAPPQHTLVRAGGHSGWGY